MADVRWWRWALLLLWVVMGALIVAGLFVAAFFGEFSPSMLIKRSFTGRSTQLNDKPRISLLPCFDELHQLIEVKFRLLHQRETLDQVPEFFVFAEPWELSGIQPEVGQFVSRNKRVNCQVCGNVRNLSVVWICGDSVQDMSKHDVIILVAKDSVPLSFCECGKPVWVHSKHQL